jgi:regulator of protease activity HflC (stomatin/prohibitin superfamily)
MHVAPAGLYRIFYVDKQERSDVSGLVPEITTDGEKLTLKVILRYQVVDPVVALGIANPVDTMMTHIETDVAQYIRTHHHSEIADSAVEQNSRLLSFFTDRHNRREPLAKAIKILGVELKEFMGDKDFVDMRRRELTNEKQTRLTRQEEEYQQEIERLKSQFKAESDRLTASLSAELNRQAAEQRAELETLEARYKREKAEIMHQVYEQKIDLDERRQRLTMQYDKFAKAFDAISQAIAGGHPINPSAFQIVLQLVEALTKEIRGGEPPVTSAGAAEDQAAAKAAPPKPSDDNVSKLTQTLLDLLKPRK